jgi:hypothetical protein
MSILRLYDLVCGHALVRRIARATQLLTGHGLHDLRFLPLCRTATFMPIWIVRINLSGLHPNTDYVHGRQHVWVGDQLDLAHQARLEVEPKATLIAPAWIQAAPSSPSMVTGAAPRTPLKRAATAAAPS